MIEITKVKYGGKMSYSVKDAATRIANYIEKNKNLSLSNHDRQVIARHILPLVKDSVRVAHEDKVVHVSEPIEVELGGSKPKKD